VIEAVTNGHEWIEGDEVAELNHSLNLIHDHLKSSREEAITCSEEARRRKIRYDNIVHSKPMKWGQKVITAGVGKKLINLLTSRRWYLSKDKQFTE
jgi:hypothetical protein